MPAIQPFTWGGSGSDAVWGIAELPFVPQATGGGSTAVAPRIVWRSDGTGDAVTWADVMALIGVQPAVEIYVDQPGHIFNIPAGVYNLRKATFNCGTIDGGGVGINLADGAVFLDWGGGVGLFNFNTNCTTAPALTFTPGAVLLLVGGFGLAAPSLVNSGTVPACEVDGTVLPFLLAQSGIGRIASSGGPAPFFNLTAGLLICELSEGIGQAAFDNDTVTGDAASALAIAHDGTAPTTWATFAGFLGAYANAAKGVAGGSGPTSLRPQGFIGPIPIGCQYFDQDTQEALEWDGNAWEYQLRTDCSVNSAYVDQLYTASPVLHAQSAGNAAGGFNGGGVGNKCILGYRVGAMPLASVLSLSWTYLDLGTTPGLPVYANLILDVNGTGTAYKIAVIDPASAPVLVNGTTVTNGDGSKTTTWLGTENLLIVDGLNGPPLPPGVGFVPATVPGAPLPLGWPSNSYSVAAILAAYPACTIAEASSGDFGLPVAPNKTPPILLITGDSVNMIERAFRLRNVRLNGALI